MSGKRVLLIDPDGGEQSSLAKRLRMQGFEVEEHQEAEDGARSALADPPMVVVANLWMPYISGVQLCRLLQSEDATKGLPIILRGPEGQRNRFWAERAGACDYVLPGRMGDLVRAIQRVVSALPSSGSEQGEWWDVIADVRDRIAGYLDEALFDAVVAGEIRALGISGDFERLFDLLSQFVSRVTSYRWLALATTGRVHVAVHHNPAASATIGPEVLALFGLDPATDVLCIEDQDAHGDESGPAPIVCDIELGGQHLGRLALAVRDRQHEKDAHTVAVIARELAGPIRIALLMEDARRLASVDPLTGIANRRAFLDTARQEMRGARGRRRLALALLDVDHFKSINDRFGHGVGDAVLAEVGGALRSIASSSDTVGRWGGEEFVVLFDASDVSISAMGERIRSCLEALQVHDSDGAHVAVTASVGVAELRAGERVESWVDRVDQLMYRAKAAGRNRVEVAEPVLALAESPAA